jgi:hypothetical protein
LKATAHPDLAKRGCADGSSPHQLHQRAYLLNDADAIQQSSASCSRSSSRSAVTMTRHGSGRSASYRRRSATDCLKADRSNRRRAARRHFTRRAVFFIGAFIGPANPTACAAPPLSCATICSGVSFTAWFCPLGEIDDRLGRGRRVAAKRKPVVCNGCHQRTLGLVRARSVHPATTDMPGLRRHVRLVPISDMVASQLLRLSS